MAASDFDPLDSNADGDKQRVLALLKEAIDLVDRMTDAHHLAARLQEVIDELDDSQEPSA